MASNIDTTKPTEGNATTQSVRDNFAAAKQEIEALQSQVAANTWGAWVEPQLTNNWSNYGGTAAHVRYRKKANGEVQITGTMAGGTIGQVAFVLPENHRPAYVVAVPQISNGAFGQLSLFPNGNVIPQVGSNVSFWIHAQFSTT